VGARALAVREVSPEYEAVGLTVAPPEGGASATSGAPASDTDGAKASPTTGAPAPDADGTAATSPPSRDADLLDDLGDEIARLAAHLHAAMRRYLELVAEFDRRGGWEPAGHRSCAHWLAYRTGHDLRTARDHVRVARALEELPATRDAMARGRLSFSQVRALTRVATPETEGDLLPLAEGVPTGKLERMVRAWRKGSRQDEAARERERHRSRRLAVFPDDDGMYLVRGRLTPEVGALLQRALEAAEDALYRRERASGESGGDARGDGGHAPADGGAPLPDRCPDAGTARADAGVDGSAEPRSGDSSPRQRRREARRRRADAIGLLAERALAAGFDGEAAPLSGTRAERYQVFVHVDPETLSAEGDARRAEDGPDGAVGRAGRSELEDGTRLSAETARRLVCDAATVQVNRGRDGQVLDVGRRARTVPPALRRALEVRDRGCRFPGCGLRFTDAHHITHWADGGATSLENTLLLCRRHHRLVHEEGWTVEWWGKTRAVFTDPRGRHRLDERPPRPDVPPPRPAEALEVQNRRRGIDPGPLDAGARWKREGDVPDRVWFRALEAGLAGAEAAPP